MSDGQLFTSQDQSAAIDYKSSTNKGGFSAGSSKDPLNHVSTTKEDWDTYFGRPV